MKVFILKEGKEYNQGVAYLDDGTMVVVDNARKMISKTIDVVVTSVLQTTAGKMIFGRFIDPSLAAAQAAAHRATGMIRARRRGVRDRCRCRRRHRRRGRASGGDREGAAAPVAAPAPPPSSAAPAAGGVVPRSGTGGGQ